MNAGLNMTEVVNGSQYQLGMLYEALLNTVAMEGPQKGMKTEVAISRAQLSGLLLGL